MNPIRRTLLASALTPAATAKSFAQSDNAASDYPRRPITIIVAFAPGGIGSTMARLVGEHLGRKLGQTVIVDNKPGANGIIGMG